MSVIRGPKCLRRPNESQTTEETTWETDIESEFTLTILERTGTLRRLETQVLQ